MLNYIDRSSLDIQPVRIFYNPYLNDVETTILTTLIRQAAPRVMIEFGCNTGCTAKTLLDNVVTLEKYIGIDVPYDHKPTLRNQYREVPGQDRAGFYAGTDPRFALLTADSLGLRPSDLEPCEAVFIDGDHSEEVVRHDSYLARVLVRPGGIIVWHDYNNPGVEVTGVLNELANSGWKIQTVIGSWLAFMKVE